GLGFNARLITTAAIAAVIIAAIALFVRRGNGSPPQTVASSADTSALAGGDVAIRGQSRRTDTSPPASVAIVPRPTPSPNQSSTQNPTGVNPSGVAQTQRPPALAQPQRPPLRDQRRSEPPVTANRPTIIPPGRDTTSLPRDSSRVRTTAEVCASTEIGDQRPCLGQLIKENDVELNAVFRRLVTAMRRKANIADQDPEPQSLVDLREAEKKWVEDRDVACRSTGSGPLYARTRAACYAGQSARRTQQLRQMLDSIPP